MSEFQTVEEKPYYLGKRYTGSNMAPERYFKRMEGDTLKRRLLADSILHTNKPRLWWIRMGHRKFIGKVWAKGHTDYIDYYLFWCDQCKSFQVDYVHGDDDYTLCYCQIATSK